MSAPVPMWIESSFNHTLGMDPLGLQSMTTDRIMPLLVPGILALSRRARYFSFHCFLLEEFYRRDPRATQQELSVFIKRREFELSIAVHLCSRCSTGAARDVGSSKTSSLVKQGIELFQRDESVESFLGGYGLYYRTPMQVFGLVAPKGEYVSELDRTLPRDIVRPGVALELAALYRSAIVQTRYYQEYFGGTQPIPKDVLEEFSQSGCLCRLDEHAKEQALIERVLIGVLDAPETTPLDTLTFQNLQFETEQRRRSVALLLWILGGGSGSERDTQPLAAFFRRTVWSQDSNHLADDGPLAETLAQWSALTARDYMQEGLATIWSDVCTYGRKLTPPDGVTRPDLDVFFREALVRDASVMLDGSELRCDPAEPMKNVASLVYERTRNMELEDLRATAVVSARALSGLILLLVLIDRLTPEFTQRSAWRLVASQGSNWQPGLLHFITLVREYLATSPTVGETLTWITKRFVIDVHERNAYSKLPNYTFRFRWVSGQLQFYRNETDHMTLPDTRLDAVSSLATDLGLLASIGEMRVLTERGWHFIGEVFQ